MAVPKAMHVLTTNPIVCILVNILLINNKVMS